MPNRKQALQDGFATATANQQQIMNQLHELRGEIAALGENVGDFERARREWEAVVAGQGLGTPDQFEYERVITETVTLAAGEGPGAVLGSMALAAAKDRDGLRARIADLEDEMDYLKAALRTATRTLARCLQAFNADLVEVAEEFPGDIIQGGVQVDGVEHACRELNEPSVG